jgi:hypothetical protein
VGAVIRFRVARRGWYALVVGIAAGAGSMVMSGPTQSGLSAQATPTLAGAGFFDAHVHLNDPAAWIAAMDEAGVPRAVVLAGRDGARRSTSAW